MKQKLLSLLGILALAVAFFSCNPEVTTTYTVTYSSEYGTVPDAISVEENTTLSETQLPILYADNAVFEGWYDGETKAVAGVYQVKGTVTLTAHWVFSVTYSSEHGIVPEPITVEKNTILTESQLPALSDGTLVFKGWFDGETKAVAGEYHVTENVTLTAHWAATATVSYHSKFGTGPESFDVELNQTLTAENLAEVSCSPYTFLGWYYSKDEDNNGTGTQAQAGDNISSDTQLYAKWKTATVSFSSAYGTVPSIKKYTGEKIAGTEIPAVSEIGYTFGGWFNDSMQLSSDFTVTDDVIFDAKWIANTYKITFKANGANDVNGDSYTQTVTFGTTAKLIENALFTRDGYAFNGWNKAADGSGTSYADEADFAVTETNDVTLYAQWDPVADETTIVDMIKKMTESGTIAAKGAFSNDLIREINSALKTLPSNVNVFLDLSNVTGLTALEDAGNDDLYEDHSFLLCTSLSEIILPSSVTSIGDVAFGGCTGLTSITIPDSVTSIGEEAFGGCTGLTSITIPDSVTSIGEYAFAGCTGLTSVSIPDSVTSIDCAFYGCTGLTSITIPDGVTSIMGAFDGCTGLTSVTIPNSVTSIMGAFDGCTGLTSITIPDGVTSIGLCTFQDCNGLTSVTIPSSVTSIGDAAFSGCTGLTNVTIPDGVTSIGEEAFYKCSSLTSITIPADVTSIGHYAFEGCTGLTSVTFADTESIWEVKKTDGWTEIGKMSATDTAGNAELLKSTYLYYDWRKKQ